MTVANVANKIREDGNGSKVAFTFSFKIYKTSDIRAYKVTKATEAAVLQVLDTDYTVAISSGTDGGTVTYAVAPTALQESFIISDFDIEQETDIPDRGALRESQIENALDRGILIDRQQQEQLDRALVMPETIAADFDATLPVGLPDAPGASVIINDDGDGFDLGPTADEIESAQTYAEAAQAAQTAAETAQGLAQTAQGAAESARNAAQSAKTAAETAETNAETAETNAETAQGLAEDAKDAAVIAQGAAESARDTAVASAGTATTQAGLAATAKTNAETAETNAETAETNAETAQGLAETAKTGAETAQGLAESARDAAQAAAALYVSNAVEFIIDGGGSALTTGVKGDIRFPFACTLTGWSLLADVSGAIKIDLWKDTYANFPPTNDDSITNGHEPEIAASGVSAEDTDIADWNGEAIAAGSILRINIDSVAAITRAVLVLTFTRT